MEAPYTLDKETAVEACKSIAAMLDRIADGKAESIMYEQNEVNHAGQKLVFFATVDPELWPRIRAAFQAHAANKRERAAIARFASDQPANQDQDPKPS